MTYITKQDIELWFNNEVTLDDTLADDLIAKNSAYVDYIAGTKFEPTQVVDEVIDLDYDTDTFYVENRPLLSIQSIYVNNKNEFEPEWTEVDKYVIADAKVGKVKLANVVSHGLNRIKISYTYGYNQVPEIVKKLVIDLCVLDVLRIMTNKKSYNDEGDVDLGTLRISGSFKYSLTKIEQLKKEVEQLKQDLYGFMAFA